MTRWRIDLAAHQAANEAHVAEPLLIETHAEQARPLKGVWLGQAESEEEEEDEDYEDGDPDDEDYEDEDEEEEEDDEDY